MSCKSQCIRGFSLLEFTISLTIASIIGYSLMSLVRVVLSAQRRSEIQQEVLEARMHIERNFDCTATVTPTPTACTDTTVPYLEVSATRPALSPLIRDPKSPIDPAAPGSPGGYTRYGKNIYLRARCVACSTCAGGKRLLFEYLEGTPPQDPAISIEPTPLLANAGWSDLLRGITIGCRVP